MEAFDFTDRKHLTMATMAFLMVAVLFVFGVRFMKRRDISERDQREWYAKQLQYSFSIRADTVINLEQKWGYGEVYFTDREGQVNLGIEDSLNATMTQAVRFLVKVNDGRFKFVIQNSDKFAAGDSMLISSKENQISIFRNRNLISKHKISSSLMNSWFY